MPGQESRRLDSGFGAFSITTWIGCLLLGCVLGCLLTACSQEKEPEPETVAETETPAESQPVPIPDTEHAELLRDAAGTWQRWIDGEVDFYEIPEDEVDVIYGLLGHVLDRVDAETVEFIDVGCSVGDYLVRLDRHVSKPIHSLGIDPVDRTGRAEFSTYLQVAVANQEPGKADFHLYGGPDLAASSLQRMKKENVSHSEAQQDEKFYHPVAIETERGTITVDVVPLSRVIEDHDLQETVIHLVKVDVQGTDLGSFLSLRRYVQNVLFFQIESIFSQKEGHKLYEGQKLFDEEKEILEALGFRLFNVARFPSGPEADVMWIHTRLFEELAPQVGLRPTAEIETADGSP